MRVLIYFLKGEDIVPMRGDVIKHRLSVTAKSKNELANHLGLSPKDISKIFSSSEVKTGALEEISSILNLPISFFFDDPQAKKVIFSLNEINENLVIGNRQPLTTDTKKDKELNFLRGKVEAYEKIFETLGSINGSKSFSTPPPLRYSLALKLKTG